MADLERTDIVWRKSETSADGQCVEVAFVEAAVLVRNSEDPSGPMLTFSRSQWSAFLDGARSGTFDAPA